MIAGLPEEEYFVSGHNACAGCGSSLAMRILTKACGKNCIACIATGCIEVVSTQYPLTAWQIPCIHSAFENVAATASGIARALKILGKDSKVIAIGGDGCMFDIGFQALSGAIERGEKVCFICYDNEAYANTGVQRSGATPKYAETTTTPVGKVWVGKIQWKKPLDLIVASHGAKYVATTTIANPLDLYKKVKKGLELLPSFIHILAPCPTGWRYPTNLTIKIARLAVDTGMFPLFEIENGELKLNQKEIKTPVKEYLELQGRFSHLTPKQIDEIQKGVNGRFDSLLNLEKSGKVFGTLL
jgi:pyruvate ferredoxin oxidoreductase beta subunit